MAFRKKFAAADEDGDAILNSLAEQLAVVDAEGTILKVNEAWNRFAQENGVTDIATVGPGVNYLHECGEKAAAGIRAVIEGRSAAFRMEYPCHSDKQDRWFVMNVSQLKGEHGGAVITHVDITASKQTQEDLRRSENTIRALMDSSSLAVVAVDEAQRILLVNNSTHSMFGYRREELLGKPLSTLLPLTLPARDSGHRPMGARLEREARRRDGTPFPIEVNISTIETAGGRLAAAFINDMTQRRQMEEAARAHAGEVQALAASLLMAQENERRRVSRELHDQICQQLASLAIEIGGLAAMPPPEDRTARLRELQARVIRVSEETRHIAYALHPSVLDDLGLVASLRNLCREFSNGAVNLAVEFSSRTPAIMVEREVASCIYRVAQESIRNAIAHSHARRVKVSLSRSRGAVTLRTRDDGKGFDPGLVKGRGGLGLIGMEERARLVRGELTIDARPGRGTRIALSVPLNSNS
jgi:PAS domain S-box-containing protein